MKRIIAFLMVIAGIALVAWPMLKDLHREYPLQQSLVRFEEVQVAEEQDSSPAALEAEAGMQGNEENEGENCCAPSPVAVLEIEKLGLLLPVLQGISEDVLRYGAGLLDESAGIGEAGNTVITAHRAHAQGRLFNRLDELEVGDEIVITTPQQSYAYRVFNTDVIEIWDHSYLYNDGEVQHLTLITCHPLHQKIPLYRLVVQAGLE